MIPDSSNNNSNNKDEGIDEALEDLGSTINELSLLSTKEHENENALFGDNSVDLTAAIHDLEDQLGMIDSDDDSETDSDDDDDDSDALRREKMQFSQQKEDQKLVVMQGIEQVEQQHTAGGGGGEASDVMSNLNRLLEALYALRDDAALEEFKEICSIILDEIPSLNTDIHRIKPAVLSSSPSSTFGSDSDDSLAGPELFLSSPPSTEEEEQMERLVDRVAATLQLLTNIVHKILQVKTSTTDERQESADLVATYKMPLLTSMELFHRSTIELEFHHEKKTNKADPPLSSAPPPWTVTPKIQTCWSEHHDVKSKNNLELLNATKHYTEHNGVDEDLYRQVALDMILESLHCTASDLPELHAAICFSTKIVSHLPHQELEVVNQNKEGAETETSSTVVEEDDIEKEIKHQIHHAAAKEKQQEQQQILLLQQQQQQRQQPAAKRPSLLKTHTKARVPSSASFILSKITPNSLLPRHRLVKKISRCITPNCGTNEESRRALLRGSSKAKMAASMRSLLGRSSSLTLMSHTSSSTTSILSGSVRSSNGGAGGGGNGGGGGVSFPGLAISAYCEDDDEDEEEDEVYDSEEINDSDDDDFNEVDHSYINDVEDSDSDEEGLLYLKKIKKMKRKEQKSKRHLEEKKQRRRVRRKKRKKVTTGMGKTTIVAMVVSRNDIREYYKGGIAWINIKENSSSPCRVNDDSFEMTYEYYYYALRTIACQLEGVGVNPMSSASAGKGGKMKGEKDPAGLGEVVPCPIFSESSLLENEDDGVVFHGSLGGGGESSDLNEGHLGREWEITVMLNAKEKMTSYLQSRSKTHGEILLILDDVDDREIISWFHFMPKDDKNNKGDDESSDDEKEDDILFKEEEESILQPIVRLLVTTSTSSSSAALAMDHTIEIPLLTEAESISLLLANAGFYDDNAPAGFDGGASVVNGNKKGSSGNDSVDDGNKSSILPKKSLMEARRIVRLCSYQPLTVRTAGIALKNRTFDDVRQDLTSFQKQRTRGGAKECASQRFLHAIIDNTLSREMLSEPTRLIKLCFAAFSSLSSVVEAEDQGYDCSGDGGGFTYGVCLPLDVVLLLWKNLICAEESTKGIMLDDSIQKEESMYIYDVLSSLGMIHTVTEKKKRKGGDGSGKQLNTTTTTTEKFLYLYHHAHRSYGSFLRTDYGGLGDQIKDQLEVQWNRVMVEALLAKGKNYSDFYTLFAAPSHMVHANMIPDAIELLKDEGFIRGRLTSMGWEMGTRRLVKDCEELNRHLERSKAVSSSSSNILATVYEKVAAVLYGEVQGYDRKLDPNPSICAARAFHVVGHSLANHRHWNQAQYQYNMALQYAARALGDHELVAATHFIVGSLFFQTKQYGRSVKSLERCLAIRKSHLGEHHPLVTRILMFMGDVHGAQGNAEAIRYYDAALEKIMRNADTEYNVSLIKLGTPDDLASSSTATAIGNVLYGKGCVHAKRDEFTESRACLERSIQWKSGGLGKSHPALSALHLELGNVLFELDLKSDAMQEYKTAMSLAKPKYGCDSCEDEHNADFLLMTGKMHCAKGDYQRALLCYEKALQILKARPGVAEEKVALLYHNAGKMYLEKDDKKNAMARFEKSLMKRGINPSSSLHLDVARTLFEMGLIHKSRENYPKAIGCFKEAVRIRRAQLGDYSITLASSILELGETHYDAEEEKEARSCYAEALRMYDEYHGYRGCEAMIASVLQRYGELESNHGDHVKALSLFNQCLELRKSVYGTKNEEVAEAVHNVGSCLLSLGDLDVAANALAKALKARKSLLGIYDQAVGDSTDALGYAEAKRGNYKKALKLLDDALEIRKQIDNGHTMFVAETFSHIGFVYREQGDISQALQYYRACLSTCQAALGEEHPDVANAYITIAEVMVESGSRQLEAVDYLKQALRIRTLAYGIGDDRVASVLRKIGTLYIDMGNRAEALKHLEQSICVRSTNSSANMMEFMKTLHMIGNVHDMEGNNEEALKNWREANAVYNEQGLHEVDPEFGIMIRKKIRSKTISRPIKKTNLFRRVSDGLVGELSRSKTEP